MLLEKLFAIEPPDYSSGVAFKGPLGTFCARCRAAFASAFATGKLITGKRPEDVYYESLSGVLRLVAVMMGAQKVSQEKDVADAFKAAADAVQSLFLHSDMSKSAQYFEALAVISDCGGGGLFDVDPYESVDSIFLHGAIKELVRNYPHTALGDIFFQTMPIFWLGCVYQSMLALQIDETGLELRAGNANRKKTGMYYTPAMLVDYVCESTIGGLESSDDIKVLDPAMGAGDFLLGAVNAISKKTGNPRHVVAANCVYGMDIDPVALDLARFTIWMDSGFYRETAEAMQRNIVCADAIDCHAPWTSHFDKTIASRGGFDAVIGNPPYIAAKNGNLKSEGQSDAYIKVVERATGDDVVRDGGAFGMVLPDPVLVRENAAAARKKMLSGWDLRSILHISGAFPDARVANAVPVMFKNAVDRGKAVCARLDKTSQRKKFERQPVETLRAFGENVSHSVFSAQKRCEFVYLAGEEPFVSVIKNIHGERMDLSSCMGRFMRLEDCGVADIYRGEEVGKAAVSATGGDIPILMGGQSISPYEIRWEGKLTKREKVRKPLDRYTRTKIILQKSTPRIVAALDRVGDGHEGFVFPQSVYAIELDHSGIGEEFLLAILNSRTINEYVFRVFTGYKMVQPQVEIEDVRAIPVPKVDFDRDGGNFERMEAMLKDVLGGAGTARLGQVVEDSVKSGEPLSKDIHDIIACAAGQMLTLYETNRQAPDARVTQKIELCRSAIDCMVDRIYKT